ncbi:hypothetical protein KOAAANKH_02734 [Brevundimonas sp. NIBR10]|nr:hypothetical protein KOAAANKH_02734 [Brevundimonas sp. NIBR10]
MGEAKSRKARFLAANPICCYCGSSPSTEEDHCPARICFREKVGPDGWSFPSCSACNRAISGTEQVVAFYIRALDHTDENYREADIQRLTAGIRNNAPEVFPKLDQSAAEKRRMMADLGIQRTPGVFLSDEPVLPIPAGIDRHFEYFARKLTAALFYRNNGRSLTESHFVMNQWFQTQSGTLADVLETLAPVWNRTLIGSRPNLDFGDQLSIVIGTAHDSDVFTYVAQFGTSLCFWGGAGKPENEEQHPGWKSYRPIKDGI